MRVVVVCTALLSVGCAVGASQTSLIGRSSSSTPVGTLDRSVNEIIVEMSGYRRFGNLQIGLEGGLGAITIRDRIQGMSGSNISHTTVRLTGSVGYRIATNGLEITPMVVYGRHPLPAPDDIQLEPELDSVLGAGVELAPLDAKWAPFVRLGAARATSGDQAHDGVFVSFGARYGKQWW